MLLRRNVCLPPRQDMSMGEHVQIVHMLAFSPSKKTFSAAIAGHGPLEF